MSRDPLFELEHQVLLDLVRSSFADTLTSSKRKNSGLPKRLGAVAPAGEDLYSYLRGIRRWIVTRELATLLHCHTETIYRRIETECMPAQRDGNRWKYYPPEIADWLERRSLKNRSLH